MAQQYALAANLLIERSQTEGVWAADMTYVPTREGWLYVSAVMNVKSRKIIGLSMGDRLSQELASAALKEALQTQTPPEGLIHRSDRGRQYARLSIFEYVMMFYNRRRRHSALGYLSPEQYEIMNQLN